MLVMDRDPLLDSGNSGQLPGWIRVLADGDDPRELTGVAASLFGRDSELRDDVTFFKDGNFGILSSDSSLAHIDVHPIPREVLPNGELGPNRLSVTCMSELGFVTIDSALGIQTPELPDFPIPTPQQAREIVYSAVQQILIDRTPEVIAA